MCFFREKLISRARESEPLSEGIAGRSGERYLHQNICTGRIRKTFAFSSSFPLAALSTGTPNPLTPTTRRNLAAVDWLLPAFFSWSRLGTGPGSGRDWRAGDQVLGSLIRLGVYHDCDRDGGRPGARGPPIGTTGRIIHAFGYQMQPNGDRGNVVFGLW